MKNISVFSATVICLLFINSSRSSAQAIQLPGIKVYGESTVYKITSGGKPITTQEVKWRGGRASFARFYIKNKAEITVNCNEARGKWDLSSLNPVDYKIEGNVIRMFLDKANKIMIQTSAKEVLYLFADSLNAESAKTVKKKLYPVIKFGIKPGTNEIVTSKIQKAINTVASKGGGILVFPAGIYYTGTIRIGSNVFLYLDAGACIRASLNKKDYPKDPGKKGSGSEKIYTRLILFDHASNAGIEGLGEIDGRRNCEKIPGGMTGILPNLIRIRYSNNILIEGVLLLRAFGWNTHILYSKNIVFRNIASICNGSDGLDIDNSKEVKVVNVLISSYDDSFVLKSTAGRYGPPRNVSKVFMNHAVLWTVKSALKFGTETNAKKMSDMRFDNVTVAGSRGALVMYLRDGAVISNISYNNITVKNSKRSIEWIIRKRNGKGIIRNITINRLFSKDTTGVILLGLDKEHLIKNVKIKRFFMNGKLVNSLKGIPGERNRYVENIYPPL